MCKQYIRDIASRNAASFCVKNGFNNPNLAKINGTCQ